jgi:hypothetical protein
MRGQQERTSFKCGYIGSYITKPLFAWTHSERKEDTAHKGREGTKVRPGHSGGLAPPTSFLADQQNKSSGTYQYRNQNTGNERNNPMQTGPDLFRPSAFLRRSDTQPEEKFVHRAIPSVRLVSSSSIGPSFLNGELLLGKLSDRSRWQCAA